MLTGAREGERQGLESGADAYVAKSADRDLLILRIRALLRERKGGPPAEGPGGAAFRRGPGAGGGWQRHLSHLPG